MGLIETAIDCISYCRIPDLHSRGQRVVISGQYMDMGRDRQDQQQDGCNRTHYRNREVCTAQLNGAANEHLVSSPLLFLKKIQPVHSTGGGWARFSRSLTAVPLPGESIERWRTGPDAPLLRNHDIPIEFIRRKRAGVRN